MIEYVAQTSHAKTLFSTHYHELTTLDQMLPCLKNVHVAANEYKGELIFLHKVKDGAVDDSYGIQVAKLADLPDDVINRAQVILDEFEEKPSYQVKPNQLVESDVDNQDKHGNYHYTKQDASISPNKSFEQAAFDLFENEEKQNEIELEIKNLNVSNMTPIEALVKLNELQNQLK